MPNSSKNFGRMEQLFPTKNNKPKNKNITSQAVVEEKVEMKWIAVQQHESGSLGSLWPVCQVSQDGIWLDSHSGNSQQKPMAKLDPSFKGLWKKMGVLGWTLSFDSSWIPAQTFTAWHINEGTMAQPASQQSSQPVIFFCRWMNTGTCKLKTNMKIEFIIATKPINFHPSQSIRDFWDQTPKTNRRSLRLPDQRCETNGRFAAFQLCLESERRIGKRWVDV